MAKLIGEVVRELRQTREIKQFELAQKAGISNTYLSDIENSRTEPSIKTVRRLANALSVDWREIFLLTGYVNSEQNKGC